MTRDRAVMKKCTKMNYSGNLLFLELSSKNRK